MVAEDAGLPGHDDGQENPLDQRKKFPPPSAPLDVARDLYADYRQHRARTLVCWRGGWMVWRGGHWSEMAAAELRSTIYNILGNAAYTATMKLKGEANTETRPWDPDKRKVANVMEAMAAIGHLSADIDPPAWIGLHSAAEAPATQMISCANGVLDLSTQNSTATPRRCSTSSPCRSTTTSKLPSRPHGWSSWRRSGPTTPTRSRCCRSTSAMCCPGDGHAEDAAADRPDPFR